MAKLNEDAIRKDVAKSLQESFDESHFDLSLKLCTCGAAFEDDPNTELARIFRELADRCENGKLIGPILDINGNTVGRINGELYNSGE